MPLNFGIDHPLQRDGNSQEQRSIRAQAPSTAPVDGRQMPDLLYFWSRMSRVLLHWDLDGRVRDWVVFFEKSVPFKLAEIYQEKPETWWDDYQERRTYVDQDNADGLELLLSYLFNAFYQHQIWHQLLRDDPSEVSQTIRNLSTSNLRFVLEAFIGIYNALHQRFGVDTHQQSSVFFDPDVRTEVWSLQNLSDGYIDPLLAGKIVNRKTILPHVLPRLDSIAEVLYKSRRTIREAYNHADSEWENLIAPNGEHQPHIGLMLAFLRIFRIVQGDFNRLTERHLQFFYRQVLQLTEQEAVPDTAHLSIELAKHVDKHSIEAGTGFKDGKDNNKTDVIFSAVEETVLNRAGIADIRTLFFPMPANPQAAYCPPELTPIDKVELNVPLTKKNLGKNFASFGYNEGEKATFGFVLGDHVLHLAEGKRTIILKLLFDATVVPSEADFEAFFECSVTTAKKWLAIPSLKATIKPQEGNRNLVEIKFTLEPDEAAIVPLADSKLNPYGTEFPLLRVKLKTYEKGYRNFYQSLKTLQIRKIKLRAEVDQVLKNINLQNDEGPINVTKTFQPFGTSARYFFYVQHPDWANKKITCVKLKLYFDELSLPVNLSPIYTTYYGKDGRFDRNEVLIKSQKVSNIYPNNPIGLTENQPLFSADDNSSSTTLELLNKPYLFNATDMVALKIQGDLLLHEQYIPILARQAEAARKMGSNPKALHENSWYKNKAGQVIHQSDIPNDASLADFEVIFPGIPYNPTLLSLSLDYHAEQTIYNFTHLLPFDDGTETIKVNQQATSTKNDIPQQLKSTLVPFIDYEGHLFIGIKDAPIEGNVSLLFQVNEYTGNADLSLPGIEWSVLTKDNAWKVLQKDVDYTDDTEGLAQAGIVRFELPPETAQTAFSILPQGHSWLRARVKNHSAAFDQQLGIHIQAIKAIFSPEPSSDLQRLKQALPAGSVKKMLADTANIAKIEQVYPSFGGQAPETPEHFYRRIAERLRHKGRVVNLWDCEHLVLEAFPQIYKVKCLPHTLGLPGMKYDLEFMNGHVTLVVIPDVRQLPDTQRDRPKASQNLLGDIKRFLEARISPFATLEVLNPRYEPIDVRFSVKFRPGKDDAYYNKKLEEEIKTFLSPWRANEPKEIQFGGEVYRSSLIDFCDSRPYVDFVQDFFIFGEQDLTSDASLKQYHVKALTARSVLAAGKVESTIIRPL